MTPAEAARVVNEAVYHPHWRLSAEARGSKVIVANQIATFDSSDFTSDGRYWNETVIAPRFEFEVDDAMQEEDVLHQVAKGIDSINAHETREFLRLRRRGRWVAPFHPHRWDGVLLDTALSRAYPDKVSQR